MRQALDQRSDLDLARYRLDHYQLHNYRPANSRKNTPQPHQLWFAQQTRAIAYYKVARQSGCYIRTHPRSKDLAQDRLLDH